MTGAIDLEISSTGKSANDVAQTARNPQGMTPLWMPCTIPASQDSITTGKQSRNGMPKSLLTTVGPEYVLRCTELIEQSQARLAGVRTDLQGA